MEYENKFWNGFVSAWDMLIDFPLPQTLRRKSKRRAEPEMLLAAFPAVGFVIGMLPVIIGGIIGGIFNSIAGAVIFALLGGLVLNFKDSGRGVLLLSSLVSGLLKNTPRKTVLTDLHHSEDVLDAPCGVIFVTLFAVVELALLFLLGFYGARFWLVALTVSGATVQGVLALETRLAGFPPLIQNAGEKSGFIWGMAGIFGVILLLVYPRPVTLLAGAAVYFLIRFFTREVRAAGGVTTDMITLAGTMTEVILLFLGLGVLTI